MSDRRKPGIYVEVLIRAELPRVWELTQEPDVHQRWDLRFSEITYLAKDRADDAQHFLYETRLGAGMAIRGTGESVATRFAGDGSATSSLKFASDDRLSLIREGAGYWRYVPTGEGVRFITWYDYRVRYGAAGRVLDYLFRPMIGWATAWSFDRLRLWAECEIAPEVSLRCSVVHAICRVAIAAIWLWHGLVPKLLVGDRDEQLMLARHGIAPAYLPWLGVAEIAFALLVLATWRRRGMFALQVLVMVAALLDVAVTAPAFLTQAFNPVTLNLAVIALAIIGWTVCVDLPSASRCLRADGRRDGTG